MNIERKFTSLKDLKVSDDGPGTIEGYRSVFGVIDEGGDIVVKGAFAGTLSDYLHSGFTAQAHDWDFKEAVGFPVDSHEDDHGWFVKSQFHSTPDAQAIRTKAKERMDAGKQVSFSFGYAAKKYIHIEAKDYEAELPKYIKADLLPAMLKRAQDFNRIRVLKEVEAIEDSIVTAPMNKRAAATGVKSDDVKTFVAQHGHEAIIQAINSELSEEARYLKGITGTESFESFEHAGTALSKFAQKMRSNHEIRLKEGRVLSSSNRAKVQACKDAMTALIADLDDLLAISEPKPKEKEIDVEALRTQWMRLDGETMSVLSR
jgi:HK97 family phage prohead protease